MSYDSYTSSLDTVADMLVRRPREQILEFSQKYNARGSNGHFRVELLEPQLLRITENNHTFLAELTDTRTVTMGEPYYDRNAAGYLQPTVIVWAHWLIYSAQGELLRTVKPEAAPIAVTA